MHYKDMVRMRTAFFLSALLLVQLARAEARVVHVVVALCDNVAQGIVPVPKTLGNGQDPAHNLYWGAAFGVKTFINGSKDWVRLGAATAPSPHVLERLVWKHATADVYLVADAYDGAHIAEAVEQFLHFAGGNSAEQVSAKGTTLSCGGASDLVVYVGHDGLMDFAAPSVPAPRVQGKPVIVLACISRTFFAAPLRQSGSRPLLWTTGLMAPEAYTLMAALDGWVAGESDAQVRERAAQAYAKYQKCSIGAARRLLVTGP